MNPTPNPSVTPGYFHVVPVIATKTGYAASISVLQGARLLWVKLGPPTRSFVHGMAVRESCWWPRRQYVLQ